MAGFDRWIQSRVLMAVHRITVCINPTLRSAGLLPAACSHRRLRQHPIHQELLPRKGMHLAVVEAEEGGLVAADLSGEVQLIEGAWSAGPMG
jgi:hypothetical protein